MVIELLASSQSFVDTVNLGKLQWCQMTVLSYLIWNKQERKKIREKRKKEKHRKRTILAFYQTKYHGSSCRLSHVVSVESKIQFDTWSLYIQCSVARKPISKH